jgi:hypothetical protein
MPGVKSLETFVPPSFLYKIEYELKCETLDAN